MDNAPIHVPDSIDPIIDKRGYEPVYLPPYSPELNPIEQLWAILKGKVKRSKFMNTDSLTSKFLFLDQTIQKKQ